MILAIAFYVLALSLGHINAQTPKPQTTLISSKSHDDALIRFSQSIKRLLNLVTPQEALSLQAITHKAQPKKELPLYRLQASQAFAAVSDVTRQMTQFMNPGQQQVIGLFSMATGLAAELLARDEQDQRYQEFLRQQAQMAANALAEAQKQSLASIPQTAPTQACKTPPSSLNDEQLFQEFLRYKAEMAANAQQSTPPADASPSNAPLPQGPICSTVPPLSKGHPIKPSVPGSLLVTLSRHVQNQCEQPIISTSKLFAHAPNLTYELISRSLDTFDVLDETTLQKITALMCTNGDTTKSAHTRAITTELATLQSF